MDFGAKILQRRGGRSSRKPKQKLFLIIIENCSKQCFQFLIRLSGWKNLGPQKFYEGGGHPEILQ